MFVACDCESSQTEWSVTTPFASFHGPVIDNKHKLARASSPDETRGRCVSRLATSYGRNDDITDDREFSKEYYVHAEFYELQEYHFMSTESRNDRMTQLWGLQSRITTRIIYKSVEHSPSWAVNNGSGSQEAYRVYNRQPLTKSCPQPDKSSLHDHIPSLEYPF